MTTFSSLLIPCVLFFIIAFGVYKKVPVYDTFLSGAKKGISVAFRILPPIIAIMVGVSMLRASGALDIVIYVISPITGLLGIPSEVLPLALLRPISGSGSLAVLGDIFTEFGTDNFIGRCASVIMGSTETTFYTIAVYFGSVQIRKTFYTLPVSLATDIVSCIASVFFVTLFF